MIHRSCCSRAASRGPPLILAVFSIRIGYSEAFFIIRVESVIGIIVLQLVDIQIVVLVVFIIVVT